MPIDRSRVREVLKQFDFQALLIEELGWDRHRMQPLALLVDGSTYTLTALAEKRGMVVFICEPDRDGEVPSYAIRRKIENQVRRAAHEHIIVYVDRDRTTQVWQWVRREPGRPAACREHQFHVEQLGDALIQKLEAISFGLDEEESLSIAAVAGRARQAFDVDRVTKRFYERFTAEHAGFLEFIKGIQEQGDREWYASLMLNRLMFIYFIQKKGFLDGDRDYLRNRLRMMEQRKGKNKFHSFYRHFLLRLFHEGLGRQKHTSELDELLGEVPYLNGGLFDVHLLEQENESIDIPDEAFETIFDFFDAYQWHLDERPLRADNEINPDVLGYIFEKYINQKQMGAYYTKEDITGYISKSCLIPYLLNRARKECPIAFKPDSVTWRLLKEDPDRYFYDAARHGCDQDMTAGIAKGLKDPARRQNWNDPAPPEFGLPTETWREYVSRREWYELAKSKMEGGEIRSFDEFLLLNLNLRQFAQDIIENAEGPEVIRAFYDAINQVSILDPACGSGAFLFSALNMLEPLYEACLERMRAFVAEWNQAKDKGKIEKFKDFRKTLEQVDRHPNLRYFILKSIVIGNLFGVDIMEEAVEICKLRLFLKLVAQVDRVEEIEPLPDIDFNIRAGNSLVGFSTLDEVSKTVGSTLDLGQVLKRIDESADIADRAFASFRKMQTDYGMEADKFNEAKVLLRDRLDALSLELDKYLASDYGIQDQGPAYDDWRSRAQPFHWFVEFYGIMKGGGFSLVIGNPPWREYASVKREYEVRGFQALSTGNLHALFTERALRLRSYEGVVSFIVQLPMVSASRMKPIRDLLRRDSGVLMVATFDDRPGKLFEGLQNCRAVIFVSFGQGIDGTTFATTEYNRWFTKERPLLFERLRFTLVGKNILFPEVFPKLPNQGVESVFEKINHASPHPLGYLLSKRRTNAMIFYQEATRYWAKAAIGIPHYSKDGAVGAPSHGRFLYFDSQDGCAAVFSLLNSSLFYAYFIGFGDCFHLSDTLVTSFPLPAGLAQDSELISLGTKLMNELTSNAEVTTIRTKDGSEISYAEFLGWKSKSTIDEIDRRLAHHFGFDEEELDALINFDAKYRLSQGAEKVTS